jgi:hypothetical protein
MEQPRINKQISLREDVAFVRGLNMNFEQTNFPEPSEKVSRMLRNPIPDSINI